MLLVVLAGLIFMVGCTTTKIETRTETVEVAVPYPVFCEVTPPPIVEYETKYLKRDDTAFEKIRSMLVELTQRKSTEAELRGLLLACIKPTDGVVKSQD